MTEQQLIPKMLTRAEVQEILHISQPTFQRLLREGRLKTVRIASRRYVLEADLADFILGCRDGAQDR